MKSFVSSQLLKTAVTTACTILSLAVIKTNSAQAVNLNLIQNGSFERGLELGMPLSVLQASSTAIDGWIVTQGSIDYIYSDKYWESVDGNRNIDLNGLGPGGIAQTFSTKVGQEYQVNFAIAGNPDNFPSLKEMQVKAAGQTAYFSFDMSGKSRKNMGWQEISWKFSAIDLKTTLEFISFSTTGLKSPFGTVLDNVSVTAIPNPVSVPEPGTLAGLFLLSLSVVVKKRIAP